MSVVLMRWLQIREERKQAVEDHVQAINKILREAEYAGTTEQNQNSSDEEWGGVSDTEVPEAPIDLEEEYIDEDRYTTVTVEAVNVDRDGLHKPELEQSSEDEEGDEGAAEQEEQSKNGADKILKEVEGHDVQADFLIPNAEARKEHIHEAELKLILSSTVKGWNFSENVLAAKDLSNHPWEFGYALGASRPLAMKASATRCSFCPQNFVAGVEMYGGLGDRYSFGLKDTSHYLAPAIAWNLPSGWTLRASPGFGLNANSHCFLLRWGVSREISGFGEMVSRMFRGRR